MGLFWESQHQYVYSNMGPFDLGIAKGKGSNNSPKVSHKFEGPSDGYPDKTEEDIGAGQEDHCYQEQACNADENLI